MQSIIVNAQQLLPSHLARLLPPRLCREIEERVGEGELVEEVRLRRLRCASLTVSGRNLRLFTILTGREMDELLLALCEGSLYAHGETLNQGYVILPRGVRVGVCGCAGVAHGGVRGVSEISSLCIRIPHESPQTGGEIAQLLRGMELTRGVLIYAPPAVGKTTLLRSVAKEMAGGETPLRVVVVDTRGELAFSLGESALLLDVLSGYPRGVGISIATRTLSAQLIVCDEIGDMSEAKEIVQAHNCGVPLLASAHAADVRELLVRPAIRILHEARLFGAYVGIRRGTGAFEFEYRVTDWEDADALL